MSQPGRQAAGRPRWERVAGGRRRTPLVSTCRVRRLGQHSCSSTPPSTYLTRASHSAHGARPAGIQLANTNVPFPSSSLVIRCVPAGSSGLLFSLLRLHRSEPATTGLEDKHCSCWSIFPLFWVQVTNADNNSGTGPDLSELALQLWKVGNIAPLVQ